MSDAPDTPPTDSPPPKPNHRVRHDGWTGERQRLFLDTLARCGNVRDACRAVGLSNQAAYRLRRVDPAFGDAWDAALKRANTSLEQVAFARAVEGVEEQVIRNGEVVSAKRRYSDSLLRLLLQASDPDKYGRTGNNPSVKAREEVEARVREIEQAAYTRAWRALVAEYRFQMEPAAERVVALARLKQMHVRMCADPWCAECHPDRAGEPRPYGHRPPADHQPIDPVGTWLREPEGEAAEPAPADPLPTPGEAWWRELEGEMTAELAAADAEGRYPALPVPTYYPPLWEETLATPAPPLPAPPLPPLAPPADDPADG